MLWSTGFIAAKYGLPYAPPLTFLWYRFLLVAALMTVVSVATRAPWPGSALQIVHIAVAAWLVHGAYLGGVFVALSQGLAAGTVAMLVGLQPLLTVLIARGWLGERVDARQWLGLGLGLVGVWLVLNHKVQFAAGAPGLLPTGLALLGISIGTLYQKRFCSRVDLRSGSVVQFAACALLYAPLALGEHAPVRWTAEFMFALGWSVLVLSVGAISLLYWLLRHGAAAERRAALLSRAAGDGPAGLSCLRRDPRACWPWPGWCSSPSASRCRAPRSPGVTAVIRSWPPLARRSRTSRVPAMRSCRNCRSGSTHAHATLKASSHAAWRPAPRA